MDKYESVNDMTNRVQQFINYLKQRHRDNETILIVTSSHLIKQLRMLHGEITMQELLNTPAKHAAYYEFDI